MPRGIYNRSKAAPEPKRSNGEVEVGSSFDTVVEEVKTLLAARRNEYLANAAHIDDILTNIEPKPRTGRPTKV